MARAAKKQNKLTPEEKLAQALVPEAEWPYQVPENWCWVKLGALAIEIADGPFGSNLKKDHYTNNREARIIQLSNIGEDGWREENTKYTTFTHAKEISRSIVEPGSIVIAKMMPAGRAIICPNNEEMYVLSSDAVKFVPAKPLNTKFLALAINAPSFRNQIQENTRGITRARTSIGKLREGNLALPPLAEQQRIVDCIESLFAKLDEAKEKAQAVVDSFEDRKAAILHKAFSGELTKKWREENRISMATWQEARLDDVCDSIFDGDHMPPPKADAGVPFIVISDVNTGYLSFNNTRFVPQEYYNSISDTRKPELGDVLYTLVGSYGIPVVVDDEKDFCFQRHIALLKPSCINSYYLWYQLQSPEFYKKASDIATGTAQQTVPIRGLRKLTIALPKDNEQEEIVCILDSLLFKEKRLKGNSERVLEQIDIMKKSILARAFRGELGTNDPDDESAVELLKNIIL